MKVEIELDDLNELKRQISDLEYSNENQIYAGNSIGYIYDKMKCYSDQVGFFGNFLRSEGYDPSQLWKDHINEKTR